MSQTDGNSKSPEDLLRIKEIEAEVEAIERRYGLLFLDKSDDVDEALGLSYESLEKLTPNECNRYCYILAQYSIIVQKGMNKAKALKQYFEARLDIIIAKHYKEYNFDFSRYDVVKNSIINGNDFAKFIVSNIQKQNVIIETLTDMTKHVSLMSQSLRAMSFNRGDRYVAD